ncbi:MAG: hypothetical protein HZB11_00480 [Candidatus Yonathbacteria bacterium]|nr:hypothetical protein [Candidatus Yonathbacteria bacterium]
MTKPIISFIVLIISSGFAFFYVVPAYNLSQERRDDIVALSKVLSTSGEIKALIDKTKKNMDGIEPSSLSRFEVFLPEKIDAVRFANNIQYIGRKNRIILSDIKVEGPANGTLKNTAPSGVSVTQGIVNTVSLGAKINQAQGAYTMNPTIEGKASVSGKKFVSTSANFTFVASYEASQLFLNDLEKSLGLINLTDISFVMLPPDSKSKAPPTYQYTVAIETYSLK